MACSKTPSNHAEQRISMRVDYALGMSGFCRGWVAGEALDQVPEAM